MPCDSSFRVGDRAGQRNISPRGREQSRRIGEAMASLRIPVAKPVLAGPVYRARDTAEEAFGVAEVSVVDGLTADDFSGPRLDWVLGEHRRLMAEPPPAGLNRVLVGHRTPAIMLLGPQVAGRAFPRAPPSSWSRPHRRASSASSCSRPSREPASTAAEKPLIRNY